MNDANGNDLAVGDRVNVLCVIVGFLPGESNNVVLKTVKPTIPNAEPLTLTVSNKHITEAQ